MNTNFNWDNDTLNLMSVLSYAIAIFNMQLNLKQVSTDELNKHLEKQDDILNKQNMDYLEKIVKQNENILNGLNKILQKMGIL